MRGFYTGYHKSRSKQRTMYEEPMRIQIKASYLRPEGQVNWGDWQSHNLFKNSHLLGYEIGASSLDQSRGKYHEELMRIQNYNMQTVPSAGKMTRRKKPFFSISYFVAQLNMNTNLLLENIKNFQAHSRLGPCFHRFWTIFATNSDVFLLCTVFINLWKQTRKTFLFFPRS